MKSQPEKPVVRLQLPAIGCCMRRLRSVPGVNMGEATRLRVLVTSAQCGNPRLTSPLPAPPRPGPRHRATGARWRHHRQWSQLSPVAPASRSRATIPDTGACTVSPASPLLPSADSEHDPGQVCPRAGLRHHLPHRHRPLQHVVSSQSLHYIRSS